MMQHAGYDNWSKRSAASDVVPSIGRGLRTRSARRWLRGSRPWSIARSILARERRAATSAS